MPGRSDSSFDELARAAAGGMSRRRFAKLLGGAALATLTPGWVRTAAASSSRSPFGRAAVKASGTCPPTPVAQTSPYYKGRCGLEEYKVVNSHGLVVGCKGDWVPMTGMSSSFNGCGPEGGIDLSIFGRHDVVPDRPMGLVNFFDACKRHDCCYGSCTAQKSTCDDDFLGDMLNACLTAYPNGGSAVDAVGFGLCASMAGIYDAAVSETQTGTDAYNAAHAVCDCCVSCEQDAALAGISDPARLQWCTTYSDGQPSGGTCTDVTSDADNCGSCGNVCSGDQGGFCCNGVCMSQYDCEHGAGG